MTKPTPPRRLRVSQAHPRPPAEPESRLAPPRTVNHPTAIMPDNPRLVILAEPPAGPFDHLPWTSTRPVTALEPASHARMTKLRLNACNRYP